jgi:hypothetical protein
MLKTLLVGLADDTDAYTSATSLADRVRAWWNRRPDETDDVAAFIESHGGVLTDSLEREISRRFGSMAGL